MTMVNKPGVDKTKLTRMVLSEMKKKAWNDLYFFCKYILGYNLMEEQPHREVCEMMMWGLNTDSSLKVDFDYEFTCIDEGMSKKPNKLLMLPRGAFKSTIATNGFPLWLAWHNPNIRVMIDSETYGNARAYLAAIKEQIVGNELLRLIATDDEGRFILEPDYKRAGGFTEEQIVLAARTKLGMKEPSLFCSGIDNAKTGFHPDVIIGDDLVSERTVGTPEQIEKSYRHYQFSLSLLEPGGLTLIIGTRYHFDDMYGRLLLDNTFAKLVRPAVDDLGQLYFPSRLTQEFLDDKLAKQGTYIYNCQYMLKPINEGDATFTDADIIYYERSYEDVNGKWFVEYFDEYKNLQKEELIKISILSDLAISKAEKACLSVIMPWGITASKKIFILEYTAGRIRYNDFIDYVFMYAKKYDRVFDKVGIESVAYQKVMIQLIQDEMRRRGHFLRIFEEKPHGTQKDMRIEALQPLTSSGTIYMKRTHVELRMQMLEFPHGKKRDIIDTLAYVVQMLKPGGYKKNIKHNSFERRGKIVNY